MSVILAADVAIDTAPTAQFGPDSPLIGWDNVIVPASVTADSSAAGFPATNIGTPSTYLRWISNTTTSGQLVTFSGIPANEVDYLAIAGHNFATGSISVRVEGFSLVGPAWIVLIPETVLPNNAPIVFRFPAQNMTALRLVLIDATGAPLVLSTAPRIAVAYAGRITLLERKLWVDHTPITYGRIAKIANGRSESGNFLGRIVLNERNEATANVQFITPTHYRSELDPFIAASKEVPFFFAWRPASYPNETGYAWMTNEPKVTHAAPHGLMQIELQMQGLA
jgi:hypothetical protein